MTIKVGEKTYYSEEYVKELKEEKNKYKEKEMILKEIVATYEIDKSNEYKFIEDLKRILWDKDEEFVDVKKDILELLEEIE